MARIWHILSYVTICRHVWTIHVTYITIRRPYMAHTWAHMKYMCPYVAPIWVMYDHIRNIYICIYKNTYYYKTWLQHAASKSFVFTFICALLAEKSWLKITGWRLQAEDFGWSSWLRIPGWRLLTEDSGWGFLAPGWGILTEVSWLKNLSSGI